MILNIEIDSYYVQCPLNLVYKVSILKHELKSKHYLKPLEANG